MKFLDSVTIKVKAGNGGAGAVSYFQDWMQKRPRPDGGNGGNGGNIIIKANRNVNTLIDLHSKAIIKSQAGIDGKNNKKHGKSGDNVYIQVPVGTLVFTKNQEKLLFDLNQDNQEVIICEGGKGGLGNAALVSNNHKFVKRSQPGSLGEEKTINLDLRLLADVALIGLPNVGKTSLLNALTFANAKTGNYEFTTLDPNLGVIQLPKENREQKILLSDLPGIISGASLNKGLGNRFLKHAERSYLLLHVVDISEKKEDYLSEFKMINDELIAYSSYFKDIPQIIIGNKLDKTEETPNSEDFQDSRLNIKDVIFTSTINSSNLLSLIKIIKKHLGNETRLETVIEKKLLAQGHNFKTYTYQWEQDIRLRRISKRVWELSGKLFYQLSKKFDFQNEKDLLAFNDYLKSTPIFNKLKTEGMKDGDTVFLFDKEFIWKD